MKILADTHTHTIASGHAYSTVDENARWAAEQGLRLLALTDHAPAMQNTTCHAYFANLNVIPQELRGVRILRGVELNILDYNGAVDLDEKTLSRLDIAIASLHTPCITPGSRKENTRAYCMAMENPYIDILGHPGDPRYDVDYMEVFRVAAETGTLLEINNASLVPGGFRDGSGENIEKLLRLCMEEGRHILLGSDAHFYTGIGDVFYAVALLEKIGFPEGLVLNTQPEEIQKHLKHR